MMLDERNGRRRYKNKLRAKGSKKYETVTSCCKVDYVGGLTSSFRTASAGSIESSGRPGEARNWSDRTSGPGSS
jgi:hypothetical protein